MRSGGAARPRVVFERDPDQSHRSGTTVAAGQVEQVRRWIENYHRVREYLEKISDINRELLRRQKNRSKPKKKTSR